MWGHINLRPPAVLFIADLFQPVDVLAVNNFLIATWLIPLVAVAPCQCFTPGGVQITSPGLTSRFSPFHSCTQPTPDVLIRLWPAGCVCLAERAPGSKVTWPAVTCVCAVAPKRGVTMTEPVKFSAAPLAEGREPFGVISMF